MSNKNVAFMKFICFFKKVLTFIFVMDIITLRNALMRKKT